jgi:ABC-type bacteriocin/lantibiotic exporter with double-glycine peptidase domain
MLLQYWNAHGTPVAAARSDASVIQKKLYSPEAHGIYASEMEKYLQESGFRVFAISGAWDDLEQHLKMGRPLIVSMQPGNTKAPLHYVVVAGIDWAREAVFVHDPARGRWIRIERAEFEKQWQAGRNWMLLAVPQSTG